MRALYFLLLLGFLQTVHAQQNPGFSSFVGTNGITITVSGTGSAKKVIVGPPAGPPAPPPPQSILFGNGTPNVLAMWTQTNALGDSVDGFTTNTTMEGQANIKGTLNLIPPAKYVFSLGTNTLYVHTNSHIKLLSPTNDVTLVTLRLNEGTNTGQLLYLVNASTNKGLTLPHNSLILGPGGGHVYLNQQLDWTPSNNFEGIQLVFQAPDWIEIGRFSSSNGFGGVVINPTLNYVPYKNGAASFGDSPWYRIGTNSFGFGSTNFFLNTYGDSTINIGHQAGSQSSIGNDFQVAIGYQALGAIAADTGNGFNDGNTAVGAFSLMSLVGSASSSILGNQNTAIGEEALSDAISAYRATAVGLQAGGMWTNVTDSVFMGYNAGKRLGAAGGGITNAIVIGANATNYANNRATIGDANVTNLYLGNTLIYPSSGGGIVPPWTNIAGVLQPNGVGANTNEIKILPLGQIRIGTNSFSNTSDILWYRLNDVSLGDPNVLELFTFEAISDPGYTTFADFLLTLQASGGQSRINFDAVDITGATAAWIWDATAIFPKLTLDDEVGTVLSLIPRAPDGTTPYTFDTSLHHTSGNLVEVKNFGTNKWTLDWTGNTVQAGLNTSSNGFASYRSNVTAPVAITFPASTVNWTNTTGANIELYIDNFGVTGSVVTKNGGQISSGITQFMTIGLQPGAYFSETYTVGTPTAKYSPF